MKKLIPLSTREPTEPPAYEVCWLIEDGGSTAYIVKSRTWFSARAEGARLLGCSTEKVSVLQGDRNGVLSADGNLYFQFRPPFCLDGKIKKLKRAKLRR